jgi:CRISPR-associated protein Csy3
MSVKLKRLPGVLSFQRGLVVSDGLFFNQFADGSVSPLHIVRHGIRGTQNINKEGSSPEGATAGSAKRQEVSQIQITDTAKLAPGAVALQVRFDVRFIDLSSSLFACAPGKKEANKKNGSQEDTRLEEVKVLRSFFEGFIARAKKSDGLKEIACRYARNIANGRFLWRNRVIARAVTTSVKDANAELASFEALSIPIHEFSGYSEGECEVAKVIAAGFRGDRQAKLSVCAKVDFGMEGPLEVFPSQNYLGDKKEGFARPLYCVGDSPAEQLEHSIRELGQAALRDQKIGNALRTFDTWYPSFDSRLQAIPVEPNGASLEAQEFFRDSKDTSGFHLMLRMAELDVDSPEGMFLLACIIRGGVFSGSDK